MTATALPSASDLVNSSVKSLEMKQMFMNLRAFIAELQTKAADVASAATCAIGAASGNYVKITGTTTITAFDAPAAAPNVSRLVLFEGALTLTHNATSLILPGAANITTAAGDVARFVHEGSGNWRCVMYQRANGTAVVSSSSVSVPVRNTVMAAAVDANGYANFVTTGSGLSAGILATAQPIYPTFAAGYGDNGAIDYIGKISADTVAACTANITNYLYFDRNVTTGVITIGASAYPYLMQSYAPSAPATDQHWLDTTTGTMKRYTGSAWETKQRVFFAEAVAGAASITSVVSYALNREYEPDYTNTLPAAGALVSISHKLGTSKYTVELQFKCLTAECGYSIGDEITGFATVSQNVLPPTFTKGRNAVEMPVGYSVAWAVTRKDNAQNAYITCANWAYKFIVTGAWKR